MRRPCLENDENKIRDCSYYRVNGMIRFIIEKMDIHSNTKKILDLINGVSPGETFFQTELSKILLSWGTLCGEFPVKTERKKYALLEEDFFLSPKAWS